MKDLFFGIFFVFTITSIGILSQTVTEVQGPCTLTLSPSRIACSGSCPNTNHKCKIVATGGSPICQCKNCGNIGGTCYNATTARTSTCSAFSLGCTQGYCYAIVAAGMFIASFFKLKHSIVLFNLSFFKRYQSLLRL
jgi:hypothetical protein